MASDPMQDTAQTLATLQPGQFVTIEGFPEGEQSRWHVNNAPVIETSGTTTVALVLQNADGDEHWLLAKFEASPDEEWRFEKLSSFEGHPPQGIDPAEYGDEIQPDQIQVIDVNSS